MENLNPELKSKLKPGNRPWYSITNSLVFAIVMKDETLCIELLNRILPDRKVKAIRFPEQHNVVDSAVETEKTFVTSVYAKSIRVDVLFEDEDCWYDLELQVEDRHDLPPRSRYYHALIAMDSLKRGEDYTKLKPGYVIFICMFDPFDEGKAVYDFQMYDRRNDLLLGDGQSTIMLNASCPEENVPEELRTFFAYLNTGKVAEDDPLIRLMDSRVREVNQEERVIKAMTLEEKYKHEVYLAKRDGRAEGLAEGRAEGHAEGRAEGHAEGRAEGAAEEKNRINALIQMLLEANRLDDLRKSTSDSEYQMKLLAEFGL